MSRNDTYLLWPGYFKGQVNLLYLLFPNHLLDTEDLAVLENVDQHHGQGLGGKPFWGGKLPWDQSSGVGGLCGQEISLFCVEPLKVCDLFVMAGGLMPTNAARIT